LAENDATTRVSTTVEQVSQWIEQCVIDLSLCPFAGVPYRAGRVRIVVCESRSEVDFLAQIESELSSLADRPDLAETTLIVAQKALPDFLDWTFRWRAFIRSTGLRVWMLTILATIPTDHRFLLCSGCRLIRWQRQRRALTRWLFLMLTSQSLKRWAALRAVKDFRG